jgi:hypothetical protein
MHIWYSHDDGQNSLYILDLRTGQLLLIFITLTFLLTWFQNPLSHGLWAGRPTREIEPFNRPKGSVGETIFGHESPTIKASLTCHPPPHPPESVGEKEVAMRDSIYTLLVLIFSDMGIV